MYSENKPIPMVKQNTKQKMSTMTVQVNKTKKTIKDVMVCTFIMKKNYKVQEKRMKNLIKR